MSPGLNGNGFTQADRARAQRQDDLAEEDRQKARADRRMADARHHNLRAMQANRRCQKPNANLTRLQVCPTFLERLRLVQYFQQSCSMLLF